MKQRKDAFVTCAVVVSESRSTGSRPGERDSRPRWVTTRDDVNGSITYSLHNFGMLILRMLVMSYIDTFTDFIFLALGRQISS